MGPVGPAHAQNPPSAETATSRAPTPPPAAADEAQRAADEPSPASAGEISDPQAALGPEPIDPNDSPYSRGPAGSFPHWSAVQPHGRDPAYSTQKRVQLTLAPSYAVFRWPFIGRGNVRIRGGGAVAAVDVQIIRWLWLRALGGVSWHPVEDLAEVESDDSLTPVARAGLLRATHVGLGLVYPLDLGRWQPLVDAGAGLMWIKSPRAVQDGQVGGSCIDDTTCEPGLRCGADNVCQPATVPIVYAGIGVDYLLRSHWAVGLAVRYHALMSNPADFPVYYTGTLRLSARF